MRDNSKLILKAKVMKQTTQTYVLDCRGMTMDEVKEHMKTAYVEDDYNWRELEDKYELDHHEISMELEIVDEYEDE